VSGGRGGRPVDLLHKATLAFRQHGVGVELEVLEGVFAGAGVDAGTKQLLRRLADDRFGPCVEVLDLGCGYGPLAHWLAAADADRRVLAVDRDARAVAATAAGEHRNDRALGHRARGSLGYDDVGPGPFDLVVSNIPAKVGPAALAHLLLDAGHRLTADGLVAVVVVERLAAEVAALLADDAVEVLATHPTRTYTVFVYRFTGTPAASSPEAGFARGVYRRGRATFKHGALRWAAEVSYSVDGFDELGRGTRAALEVLGRPPRGVVVVEGVGQGHLPLALRSAGHADGLRLVDRDLLALRTAAANLGGGAALEHAPCLTADHLAGASLAIVSLPEREPVAVTAAVLGAALAEGAPPPVVLHGRAADVSRVLELLRRHGARLTVDREAKVGGHRAVATHRR
jgi:16S rRNA (guanine1207-N2)-methyltransferase